MIRCLLLASLNVLTLRVAQAANAIPGDRVEVVMTVKVSLGAESEALQYEYTLKSAPSSVQSVERVAVVVGDREVAHGGTIEALQGPEDRGWSRGGEDNNIDLGPEVSWTTLRLSVTSDGLSPPLGMVGPGRTLDGFRFRSRGLPAIRLFYAQGWVQDMTETEVIEYFSRLSGTPFANMDEIPSEVWRESPWGQPLHMRAFRGETIAPEVLRIEQMAPPALVDRLIGLKDQAARLGWIKDPGVVTSLNQKLANARKALGKLFGGKKAARGILGAFVNELDALRGKQVDDNAYYLLRVNAEYLIVRMGGVVPVPSPSK